MVGASARVKDFGDGRGWLPARHGLVTLRHRNPAFAALQVDQAPAPQAGGNMEGKEGYASASPTPAFTTVTTDASCGAINNMHDSLLPLAGMVPMVTISGRDHLRRRRSGLTACCCSRHCRDVRRGLMAAARRISRQKLSRGGQGPPRHPGPATRSLASPRLAVVFPLARVRWPMPPARLPEALRLHIGDRHNGSAFAGLSPTAVLNDTLGLAMFIGRFPKIVPMLGPPAAGAAAIAPPGGTFPHRQPAFVGLVVGVIAITGGLIIPRLLGRSSTSHARQHPFDTGSQSHGKRDHYAVHSPRCQPAISCRRSGNLVA